MNSRIISIDVLRGFALLGILVMNITFFAMPLPAYLNPFVLGSSVLDQVIFAVKHVLADQKFMAIFSMLFGASTLLFVQGAAKKGEKAGWRYYSRNLWLLVIGLIHSVFIWHGDILVLYALCSLVLFFFRNLAPRVQLTLGVVIYLIPVLLNVYIHSSFMDQFSPSEQQSLANHWHPNRAGIQKEMNAFRGSYAAQIDFRLETMGVGMGTASGKEGSNLASDLTGLTFLVDFLGRALGMMLIGMALFSQQVFSNLKERSFYLNLVKYGMGVGISLSSMGIALYYYHDWAWPYSVFLGRLPNTLATPFTALGYVGLVMLWTRSSYLSDLQERLKWVGKSALTCYLAQSVIATFIFYEIGLGLYGDVNRGGQLVVMALIWGILLVLAPLWLKRFQYGPVEWLWRSLTYFRWMPLKK